MSGRDGVLFLGGREETGEGRSFTARNPATGEALAPVFHDASSRQIDEAARAAEAAAAPFAALAHEARSAFLRGIAAELIALGDELLLSAYAETALPMLRLQSERTRTTNQLGLFADLIDEGSWVDARIDRADPARQPARRPDLRRMLIPLGPVAVFGASNFPLAFSVAGGDSASALAAGCPIVVKAHPAHPGTSELTARAILRAADTAGMPPGVFSMVHGTAPEVGLELVRHPAMRAVGFTGSLRAGRALFDAAAKRAIPIPVFAEMGSQNPVFLLPGALAERGPAIVQGVTQAVTLGAGQFCTNPGLLVLLRGEASRVFLSELGRALAAAPAGTMLHAGIKSGYDAALSHAAAVLGVDVVASATARGECAETEARAALLKTDAKTFLHSPALTEEIFGPATLAVLCQDREEMEQVARTMTGHLTATIHGTEEELTQHEALLALLRQRVGRLIWNGYPTGVEVTPAMHHGGPYPATTDARATSVGTASILRFARPICYQDLPHSMLPPELRDENPLGIWRLIDGRMSKETL